MAIKSPAKLLKLWNKINGRFGFEEEEKGKKDKDEKKKPLSEKEKTAVNQRKKIDKGLTSLKRVAASGVKTAAQIKSYEKVRTPVLKVLTIFCRTLNSTLHNLKDQTQYRKHVRKFTMVAEELHPGVVDPNDPGEPDLHELMGVDDTHLDAKLSDPKLGESTDDISFDEGEGESGTDTAETAAPAESNAPVAAPFKVVKPPAPSEQQERLLARLKVLLPDINQARAEKTPRGEAVKVAHSEINVLIGKKEFAQANAVLDRVAGLLKPAAEPAATAPADVGPAEKWKAKLAEWTPAIKAALAANGPDAAAIAGLLAEATALATAGDDMVQALAKLTQCRGLAAPRSDRWAGGRRPTLPVPPETAKWEQTLDLGKRTRGEFVGKGNFSKTYWVASNDPKAPKAIIKVPSSHIAEDEMEEELAFYRKAGDHPNIVKCLGIREVADGQGGTVRGLVMEGIQGENMEKTLKGMRERYERGDLSHEEFWGAMQHTMRQSLSALAHLAKQGIVHNDIKSDNLMVDAETGEVKLIDFGLATEAAVRGEMIDNETGARTPVNIGGILPGIRPIGAGTTAPESAQPAGEGYNTAGTFGTVLSPKADTFGGGGVAFEAMEGQMPLYGDNERKFDKSLDRMKKFGTPDEDGDYERILHPADHRTASVETGETVTVRDPKTGEPVIDPRTGEARSVETGRRKKMAGAYAVRAGDNPTAEKYGQEATYVDFVNRMMHPNPAQRLSAAEALEHPFLKRALLDEESARAVLKGQMQALGKTSPAEAPHSSEVAAQIGKANQLRDAATSATQRLESDLVEMVLLGRATPPDQEKLDKMRGEVSGRVAAGQQVLKLAQADLEKLKAGIQKARQQLEELARAPGDTEDKQKHLETEILGLRQAFGDLRRTANAQQTALAGIQQELNSPGAALQDAPRAKLFEELRAKTSRTKEMLDSMANKQASRRAPEPVLSEEEYGRRFGMTRDEFRRLQAGKLEPEEAERISAQCRDRRLKLHPTISDLLAPLLSADEHVHRFGLKPDELARLRAGAMDRKEAKKILNDYWDSDDSDMPPYIVRLLQDAKSKFKDLPDDAAPVMPASFGNGGHTNMGAPASSDNGAYLDLRAPASSDNGAYLDLRAPASSDNGAYLDLRAPASSDNGAYLDLRAPASSDNGAYLDLRAPASSANEENTDTEDTIAAAQEAQPQSALPNGYVQLQPQQQPPGHGQ